MKFHRGAEAPTISDEHARTVPCVRKMAFALVLQQTGTEFDDGVMESVCDTVAAFRMEHDLSPDYVQRLLEGHEPTLASGDQDWLSIVEALKAEDPQVGQS